MHSRPIMTRMRGAGRLHYARGAAGRGFTLIEVLVVVAIIGLLIAILVPALSAAKEQARRTVCATSQKQIITAVHMYSMKYGGYVPFSLHAFNASLTWIAYQQFQKPYGYVHLGLLYGSRLIPSPYLLYCSSNQLYPHIYPSGWETFSAGGGIELKATGYMYAIAGQINAYRKGERLNVKLSDLKREALVSCMFLGKVDKRQPARVWPHRGGVNGAYADGGVQLVPVKPTLAGVAFRLYEQNNITQMDYFAYCFFRLLSGDSSWMNAFPSVPPGR